MDLDRSVTQQLMTAAHAKWKPEMKYPEFLAACTEPERIACMAGHYNYQVENGGHRQWVDNGYGLEIRQFVEILIKLGNAQKPASPRRKLFEEMVKDLGKLADTIHLDSKPRGWGNYWKHPWEDEDSPGEVLAEEMDPVYYEKRQKLFLATVESYLRKLTGMRPLPAKVVAG